MGVIIPARVSIDLTFTLDTSAYAVGDLLADLQELTLPFGWNHPVSLIGMHLRDEDDQAAAGMDVIFSRSSTTLGAENGAFAPSDALGRDIMGVINIEAMDWQDIGGSKLVTLGRLQTSLLLQPGASAATGYNAVWVGLVTYGTPTQTASGIRGTFVFE